MGTKSGRKDSVEAILKVQRRESGGLSRARGVEKETDSDVWSGRGRMRKS